MNEGIAAFGEEGFIFQKVQYIYKYFMCHMKLRGWARSHNHLRPVQIVLKMAKPSEIDFSSIT